MKRPILSIAFLLLLIIGTILILRNAQNKRYLQLSGDVFGTSYHITYYSSKPLDNEVKATLQRVDATFSMFNPSSLTARLNAGIDTVLNDNFIEVFNMAQQVAQRTNGAFDITVAPLVNLWGFGIDSQSKPSKPSIDSIKQFVGYDKVSLQQKHLRRTHPNIQLDFSAIAKGYACDALANTMKRHQVEHFMIEIGGEVICRGDNPKGKTWNIAVQNPQAEGDSVAYQTILPLKNRAVATSGNYRNFYYKNGRRYAHIINPHTGYPVEHTLLSATVVARQCALADAYATAFMVMGLTKAQQLLQYNSEIQALLIYEDNKKQLKTWCTPELEKLLQ